MEFAKLFGYFVSGTDGKTAIFDNAIGKSILPVLIANEFDFDQSVRVLSVLEPIDK